MLDENLSTLRGAQDSDNRRGKASEDAAERYA
jgi:hypothetical protein